MKRKSAYSTMKTHELARITRERGLKKPDVMSRSEWADFLEADDAKRQQPLKTVESTDAEDAPETDTSVNTSAKRKAKSDAKS